MKFDGELAILTQPEQEITGYNSPVHISLIDVYGLEASLSERERDIQHGRTVHYSNADRRSLLDEAFRFLEDKKVVRKIIEEVVSMEIDLWMGPETKPSSLSD